MSESAYGGESVPDWDRYGNEVFEDDVPLRGGASYGGESARGESASGWSRHVYTDKEVKTLMEIISPRPKVPNYMGQSQPSREQQRKTTTRQQEETPKQQTRVIRGQSEETASNKPTENKTRVIRGPEKSEHEDSVYDIGELRKQVMGELYDEFFTDIKNEVREELLKEKPIIVREITDELREKLKADLRKGFIRTEEGGR